MPFSTAGRIIARTSIIATESLADHLALAVLNPLMEIEPRRRAWADTQPQAGDGASVARFGGVIEHRGVTLAKVNLGIDPAIREAAPDVGDPIFAARFVLGVCGD